MMRAVPWRIVTPTFGFEPKGDRRAADKRAVQAEIDESWEDIDEVLMPPSRERRMPG